MQPIEFISHSEKQTAALGARIALCANAGDIFALFGTLGMGKSVFARAFIKKISDADDVPSPTFTLLQVYESSRFDIYHYDMYRIKSPEEVFELGIEDAFHYGVSIIEWPEKMGTYLPKYAISIKFMPLENDSRRIIITCDNGEQFMRIKKAVNSL